MPHTETPHADRQDPSEYDQDPLAQLSKQEFEALARFRFGIRRYLRYSEDIVRSHGVSPQQYQLLLALKGFPGRESATVAELAERLQLRHHSAVELINRAQRATRRALTPSGERTCREHLPHRRRRTTLGTPQRSTPQPTALHGNHPDSAT